MTMKKIFNIPTIVLLLIGTVYFSSCEKIYDGTYDRYEPTPITNENVNLKYEPLVAYPIPDVYIESKAPTYDAEGPVDFGIDTVIAVTDSKFQIGKFKIDRSTGAVGYDNKGGTIEPGEYHVSVSILNVNGYAIVDSAFKMKIIDVPIEVTADPDKPNVEFLFSGVVSTLSYTPIDVEEGDLGNVQYSIKPVVSGFSINGKKVEKDLTAKPGIHKITIIASTDLGDKEFKDLITVTVGEEPTLKYMQQNGTDSLGKVTLSPISAYSTTAPTLTGMTAEGWEIIFPDNAPQELLDAATIDNTNGVISVAGGAGIPDGDYLLGVKVGYAGDWVTFDSLFSISVKTEWGSIVIDNTDLANFTFEKTPESVRNFKYEVADEPHIKLGIKANSVINCWAISTAIIMPTDADGYALKVTFDELLDKKEENYQAFTRTVEFSYDNSSWMTMIAADNNVWPMDTPGRYTLESGNISFDPTQASLYVKWHYSTTAAAGGNFFLNTISFKYSIAHAPVEE